jgi:hypothetical protein
MSREIDIQQENVSYLLNLIKENPELPIMPMVSTECVGGDDFSYWAAEWGKASIEEYWVDEDNEGRIYYKSSSYDDLVDKIMDEREIDFDLDPEANDLEEFAKGIVNKYEWTKAIFVKINEL